MGSQAKAFLKGLAAGSPVPSFKIAAKYMLGAAGEGDDSSWEEVLKRNAPEQDKKDIAFCLGASITSLKSRRQEYGHVNLARLLPKDEFAVDEFLKGIKHAAELEYWEDNADAF